MNFPTASEPVSERLCSRSPSDGFFLAVECFIVQKNRSERDLNDSIRCIKSMGKGALFSPKLKADVTFMGVPF